MCFKKNLQIILTQKEVRPICRADLIFYIVYPSKMQRYIEKSHLQCHSVQGHIPQPFWVIILFYILPEK